MSQKYVPPEIGVNGPWLLDNEKLENLDSLISKIDEKLEESQRKEISVNESEDIGEGKRFLNLDDAIMFRRESFWDKHIKTFTIVSKDSSKLSGSSFRELVTNPRIDQFKPKELSIDVEYGKSNQFQMSFRKSILGDLRFKLQCYEPSIQEDLRYEVQRWIDDNKPGKASQLWRNYSSLIFVISMLLIWISLIMFSNPDEISSLDIYHNEISGLLEEGVKESNRDKALELLLKLNTGYIPEEFESQLTYNYNLLKITGLGFILTFLGLYPPKTTIGVGRYKSRIYIYRYYIKIVLITIPTLLILGPLVDWIKSSILN